MIKTNSKSKPASGFTHSLGSKQISESLQGIEMYHDLSISFNKEKGARMGVFVPGWTGQYMKGNSKDLLGFWKVISGSYSELLDKWSIHVNAVEIKDSKPIKEFLIETGLPLLRGWLASEKSETWYNGRRYFQIGLNEDVTEYCIWETHNDRTVTKKIELISNV